MNEHISDSTLSAERIVTVFGRRTPTRVTDEHGHVTKATRWSINVVDTEGRVGNGIDADYEEALRLAVVALRAQRAEERPS